ncbi:hypothetical protein Val02_66930 [Virgisporangium aliadipatigenens]|uniref:Nudix hydrolase domain-containing protein n=2 Tax=Virgisporangium aliadipatigenens TaxID=741659 RepID=A0A8J3YSR8_9ACTN|nr:hypothetical protein Val02_66930 [Virgisporangium aliadipatigenens]
MSAQSPARRGPVHTARRVFYRAFYGMPASWRRRAARTLQPRYIIGAVIMVRQSTPDGERLLLLRQPPGNGWGVPGGLMDRGEEPIQCAARELGEEAGIKLDVSELRPANPNAIIHTKGRWVDCVFEAEVPADVTPAVDGAEVYEAVFHPIDNLPPLAVPTARLLAHYGIGPYAK